VRASVQKLLLPRPFNADRDFYIFSSFDATNMGIDHVVNKQLNRNLLHMIGRQSFLSLTTLMALIRGPTYDPPTYTTREILENEIAFNLYFPIHSFLPTKVEAILQTNGSERFVEQLDTQFLVSAVENEITKCGRTVFADTTEEVNREFAYLSKYYSAIEFFKSKESILRIKRLWIFPKATIDTKLIQQVHQMIAAGIYDYLESIFLSWGESPRVNYTLKNRPENKLLKNEPQAISLGDKIQACFFMYFIFISVCFICFFVEVKKLNWNSIDANKALLKCKHCSILNVRFKYKVALVYFKLMYRKRLLVENILSPVHFKS